MPCLVKLDPVVLENKFYEIRLFIFIYFYFRHLVIISLWNRAWTFDWTNLNPFTQKCLVQSSVEVCQWFLKRFLKFINLFSLFRFYPPLEKGIALHFYSDYQWCFVPSLVEIGPVLLWKKMKMWKVYLQTNERRRTDNKKIWLKLSAMVI